MPGEKADVPVVPDCILNRRKNKQKKYEYEVKWMHKSIELSCWVSYLLVKFSFHFLITSCS